MSGEPSATTVAVPLTTALPVAAGRSAFLPEVEALRGVAIALVVIFHLNGILRFRFDQIGRDVSLPGAFVWAGHTGVSLFFVLSGFLLVAPFLREARGGEPVDRRAYFVRRALRILPLYWLVVATASVVLSGDLLRGVPYFFFLNSLPGVAPTLWPFSGVWWSLATEAQFYLVLPLLPLLMRRGIGRGVGLFLLGVYVSSYVRFVLAPSPSQQVTKSVFVSLFGRAPLFAWGAVAACVADRWGRTIRRWLDDGWWRAASGDLLLVGVVVLLGALLQWVVKLSFDVAETSRDAWHVLEGGLWTCVLLLVLLAPLRTKRLIANRPLTLLGRWSYSLYLIHYPILWYSVMWLKDAQPRAFRGWGLASSIVAAPDRRRMRRALGGELPLHRAAVPRTQAGPRRYFRNSGETKPSRWRRNRPTVQSVFVP
jgi:peptidoglycan/LPS O-acetylase OafA/YrhL